MDDGAEPYLCICVFIPALRRVGVVTAGDDDVDGGGAIEGSCPCFSAVWCLVVVVRMPADARLVNGIQCARGFFVFVKSYTIDSEVRDVVECSQPISVRYVLCYASSFLKNLSQVSQHFH